MKIIITLILLVSTVQSSAQSNAVNGEMPRGSIQLITINENMLKGLLLEVKDSSVIIYPGKFKEWRKDEKYMPVEFGYPNIKELVLKRKNHNWKRYSINGNKSLFNEFKNLTK